MFNNIIVSCVGNICRSPMAEALLNERFKQSSKSSVSVSSAGIGALVGYPADPLAQSIMLEKKRIDISSHRARQATLEILLDADLILVMEKEQQRNIELMFASLCGRVHRIGMWGDFDVPDPYRMGKVAFEQAFDLIAQGVDAWFAKLIQATVV